MRRSEKEEEEENVDKEEGEGKREHVSRNGVATVSSSLLSSPADGRHGQDEEHHRTGTIQSLQRQGEDSYSAHWREGRSTKTTSLFLNAIFGSPV